MKKPTGQKRKLAKKETTKSTLAQATAPPPPSRLPVISNRRGALPRNNIIKRRKIEKPLKAMVKPVVEPLKKRNQRRRQPPVKIEDQNNQKKEEIEIDKAEIKAEIESVMIDVSQPVIPMFPMIPDLSPPIIEPIIPMIKTINDLPVNVPKVEQKPPLKSQSKEDKNEKQLNGQYSRRLASKPRKRWNKDEVCSESEKIIVTSSSRPRSQGSSVTVQGPKEKKTPRRLSEPNKLAHLFELATTPKGVKYHEVISYIGKYYF